MIAYRTQEELAAGLAKWQRLLHLQDWELTAALVPQTTAWSDRLCAGECQVRRNYLSAHMQIASYETLDLVAVPVMADMERTLVHELLHCVFRSNRLWDKDPGEPSLNHYEHAIEQTARALVELDRRAASAEADAVAAIQELRG